LDHKGKNIIDDGKGWKEFVTLKNESQRFSASLQKKEGKLLRNSQNIRKLVINQTPAAGMEIG
jgi:hypothetical protein